jgi:hypothetical protein
MPLRGAVGQCYGDAATHGRAQGIGLGKRLDSRLNCAAGWTAYQLHRVGKAGLAYGTGSWNYCG